uniref:Uncharacterized protein n=1 Tax=Nelumbo nucifera TaxID=4432 RepID=A0A822YVD3_NELNU|nr:TPA_asm: hypothetical protein HUJ06_006703 [Nelumbo nucifera]
MDFNVSKEPSGCFGKEEVIRFDMVWDGVGDLAWGLIQVVYAMVLSKCFVTWQCHTFSLQSFSECWVFYIFII